MISFLILLVSLAILASQASLDKRATALSPHILFQVYFIIQLPLNLFLGTNYYLPRFDALSPLTPAIDVIWLGSFILVAQSIFVATIYMAAARPIARQATETSWPRGRVNLICAGIFVMGYAAFFTLVLINGGFAAFAVNREAWRTSGVGGQGWVLFPATTMLAIAMCAVLLNNRDWFAGKTGLFKFTLVYVVTALPAFQLGFRALIFLPLLQACYFYHRFIRRFSGKRIIVGSLTLMVAFTLYGIQREIPYNSSHGSYFDFLYYISISRPDITYTVALRSMGADIVQRTMDHVDTFNDYVMFFPSFIESATIAIPSSLWPDKPIPLSVQFSRDIFGIDGGVSPTILGEGIWHADFFGVIAFMVVAGLLHAYFRSLEHEAMVIPSSSLLMLSLYPSLIMMAESFQGYFNGIVLIVIANWVFRWAFGSRPVLLRGDAYLSYKRKIA